MVGNQGDFIMKMIILTVMIGALLFLVACSPAEPELVVTNFEECIAAGNPAMESYPRQCAHDGETFTEIIDNPVGPDEPDVPPIGGDRDEQNCLGPAGYSYDELVGACTRSWELDGKQKAAAKVAIDSLGSDGWTVVSVAAESCDGCFTVTLDRNQAKNVLGIADGKVISASGGVYPCTREYVPVCGSKVVQCIQAPCNPVRQTYSNRCEAEAAGAFDIMDGDCEDVLSYDALCDAVGGNWLAEHEECEGMSEDVCVDAGGSYDKCASACRHDSGAVACTMQCVLVCSFA